MAIGAHEYPPEYDIPLPILDWDVTDYVGDGDNGAYHGALHDGHQWWALVCVDCEHFTDSLPPIAFGDNENAAIQHAKDMADEWWYDNRTVKQFPGKDNLDAPERRT